LAGAAGHSTGAQSLSESAFAAIGVVALGLVAAGHRAAAFVTGFHKSAKKFALLRFSVMNL
jgi:hypothetical protein